MLPKYETKRTREMNAYASRHVGFERLIELFDHAIEAGAKYPKIRLVDPADKSIVVLSRAGSKARRPGTINVTDDRRYPDNAYYGYIDRHGIADTTLHVNAERAFALVKRFAADPIEGAKEQARASKELQKARLDPRSFEDRSAFEQACAELVGECCFCGLPLSNQDSIARGYGPICADKFGLPKGGLTIDRTYEVEAEPRPVEDVIEQVLCERCKGLGEIQRPDIYEARASQPCPDCSGGPVYPSAASRVFAREHFEVIPVTIDPKRIYRAAIKKAIETLCAELGVEHTQALTEKYMSFDGQLPQWVTHALDLEAEQWDYDE